MSVVIVYGIERVTGTDIRAKLNTFTVRVKTGERSGGWNTAVDQ